MGSGRPLPGIGAYFLGGLHSSSYLTTSTGSWGACDSCSRKFLWLIRRQRPLEEPKSVSDLNTSMLIWYRLVFSNQPDDFLKGSYSVVHIADMAKANSLALRKENVGGQRMIISSGWILKLIVSRGNHS